MRAQCNIKVFITSILSGFVFLATMCSGAFAQAPPSGAKQAKDTQFVGGELPIVLQPATTNATLEQYAKKNEYKVQNKAPKASIILPFFDDFTYNGPYPTAEKWVDKKVFVNNTYSFYPPTYGVATFDAIDEKGQVYSDAGTGISFSADTLTSLPIRLDSVFYPEPRALTINDNIILSFYYQPGGGWGDLWEGNRRGVSPKTTDKLLVEFYSEELSAWIQAWSTDGMSLEEFCPLIDSTGMEVEDINYFRRVEIPIKTPGFNKKDFKFRFRAYSSVDKDLKSAGGQWHIDYVYLNCDRLVGEVYMNDVSFVDVTASITSPYTSVPKKQFKQELLRKEFSLSMTNLSEETLSCRYRYFIREAGGTETLHVYPQEGEINANIYSFVESGYTTDPDLSKMPLSYTFPGVNPDNAITYEVEHVIKSGRQGDVNEINDTIRVYQTFGDEYAYDDGSSEAGLGLTYPDGAFAYRFELYKADTLSALRIFFNRSYADVNNVLFTICVWSAEQDPSAPGGFKPGSVLYESPYTQVAFEEGVNKFYTYNIEDQSLVLAAGNFFVGIKQIGKTYMNVGFDQNTRVDNTLLYHHLDVISHEWNWRPVFYTGSLMIRPAFGVGARNLDNEENEYIDPSQSGSFNVCKIYPNPIKTGELNIVLPKGFSENKTVMTLTSMHGTVILKGGFSPTINVENIKAGLYLLRLYNYENGSSSYAKVVRH